MWKAQNKRNSFGELEFTKVENEHLMSIHPISTGERKEYLEAELHYNRTFGDHLVGGVLKYTQEKIVNTSENFEKNAIQAIDRRHQGLAGRFTYGWKYRYFVDFNFGYNGSGEFCQRISVRFLPCLFCSMEYCRRTHYQEESYLDEHVQVTLFIR